MQENTSTQGREGVGGPAEPTPGPAECHHDPCPPTDETPGPAECHHWPCPPSPPGPDHRG
ncbi:hypothetical protein ABH925_000326 [Streptacidiphilus sp. EB129]